MKIKKLLGARLLVRQEFTKDVTDGGIILPGSMKARTQEGVVTLVGRGHTTHDGMPYPCCAKVGDRILYGKMAGEEIDVEGEKQVIIRDEDIVAIIKNREVCNVTKGA